MVRFEVRFLRHIRCHWKVSQLRKEKIPKSQPRTKIGVGVKLKRKLMAEEAKTVKGGAETTPRAPGGANLVWIDLGYPAGSGSGK